VGGGAVVGDQWPVKAGERKVDFFVGKFQKMHVFSVGHVPDGIAVGGEFWIRLRAKTLRRKGFCDGCLKKLNEKH
jgi:hypothetical protein